MSCRHECPACEATTTCYPPCKDTGLPKLCRFCAADDECTTCNGTGEVMLHTGNSMREDTRGYEEVACPDCIGVA